MSGIDENLNRLHPERQAGGFSCIDGAVEFYTRIQSLLHPDMIVLDLGAGRGTDTHKAPTQFIRQLTVLKGRVAKVVGVDVDTAVMDNPYLDEAHVMPDSMILPFEDASFDLVFSDYVLEHIATPELFSSEVARILKPGGWFCARTPNRWGPPGVAINLIPNKYHSKILRRLQSERSEEDVFPTTYKMNTKRKIRKFFSNEQWKNYSYYFFSEPPYIQKSYILMYLVEIFMRISPKFFWSNLYVFLKKK